MAKDARLLAKQEVAIRSSLLVLAKYSVPFPIEPAVLVVSWALLVGRKTVVCGGVVL